MTKEEVGKCLEDKELAPLGLKADNATILFEILNKDDTHMFTFADYMFMRRVNIGWGDCAGGTIMSQINIACGMKIVVPGMIAS